MKYSYKWLKKLVDIDATPEQLADDLSLKSVEIENIEKFGGDFLKNVVVGEIVELNKHPNADKLQVTKVDVGENILQIVCGAPNIGVGQKVPVVLVGTKLPMGEIKEAKIRGVESFGMLCAEDELGLGGDHTGILILDPSLQVGTRLSEIYNDYILDGKPGANRGDLLNHVGLAREVAAIYGKENVGSGLNPEPKMQHQGSEFNSEPTNSGSVEVEIENLEACPLYTARLIKGVKIGPSPIWMQQALLACGMRPINNIVDVTNYVMLEYGNPLHAFDARKIPEVGGKHKIVVRLTKKGELIRTLDGKDHEIPKGLLVIADHKNPIAVAGVMGGENSEIDATTTDIILESANFSRKHIRKSQTELGIVTEASSRFAKGLSRQLALMGLERATQLFEEVCGGQAVETPIIAGALPEAQKAIEVDFDKINTFLSIDISKQEAVKILERLGFLVNDNQVTPPAWRGDVFIWQDVAEEVGRIYGLDKVKEKELATKIDPKTSKDLYFEQAAKKYLSASGLTEAYSMSILSSQLIEKTLMKEHFFEITNPLNEFDKIMRGGLLSGLLEYAAENSKKFDRFSLFDLSKVYLACSRHPMSGFPDIGCLDNPANEERRLGLLVYGEKPDEGLFILKKHLEKFAKRFGIPLEIGNWKLEIRDYMHPGRCGGIYHKEELVGQIYEVHPVVLENLGLKNRAWVGDIILDSIVSAAQNIDQKFSEIESEVIFKEYSRFEVSKRDIAIIVDDALNHEEISKTIRSIDDKITSVDLFDEYSSEKFGPQKKSLAYHLVFQATDHTLNDKEAEELFKKVTESLGNKYKAELRK